MSILHALGQSVFLPAPTFKEEQLGSQAGRVFIVTGGYAGVGKELVKILYQADGTIYIAGRAKSKYDNAVEEVKRLHPNAKGKLDFIHLDLADMTTIKAAADSFLAKEERLDVLTNNAGVMTPPAGSKTEQGFELQLGTNVLGPWLFTHLLTPILTKTAASSPAGSVRVTWAASIATQFAPKSGIKFDQNGAPQDLKDPLQNYAQTKSANVLLAKEFATKFTKDGVISNAWNPGNLKSELQRHQQGLIKYFTAAVIYEVKNGAYTELFAGWAPEAGKSENAGRYVIPWGRFGNVRSDIEKTTNAGKLWSWCEQESQQYLEGKAKI